MDRFYTGILDSLPFRENLHHVRHEFQELHFTTCIFHFGGSDDLQDLLFGGNAAQESEHSSNLSDIDGLVTDVIEDAEDVGDSALQIVGYLN